jgi:hypothetical protein
MTTETSTTAISSISGSQPQSAKSSKVKPNNVQKRAVYQFEAEKIELQSTETPCNTRLGKVI